MSVKMLDRASLKATLVDEQHAIEFYALAFSSTPDKQGDRIESGAVDEWLAAFYKNGFPLPISFTHAAVKVPTDPFAIVGYAPADPEHVFKDEHGLRVRGFLDTGSNETAQQVYALTKRGIINGASVAYISEDEKLQRDGSVVIRKMSILEAGPCLDPANDEAFVIAVKNQQETERPEEVVPEPVQTPEPETTDAELEMLTRRLENRSDAPLEADMPDTPVKAQDPETTVSVTLSLAEWEALKIKAGRPLSAVNAAKLRKAREAIDELLALVDDETSSASANGKANEEEPEEANSEEPSPNADLHEALAAI